MEKQLFSKARPVDRPVADTLSADGQRDQLSSGAAILLVDDNPEVARAMRIAFEVAGHKFDHASSPEEAYSRLATEHFDAVLLDLNFSVGRVAGDEGLACLARIMSEKPSACVVVITAHSGIRIAVAAMQAGARDFIMKPWRNAELIGKVEAAIAKGVPRALDLPVRAAGPAAPVPALLLGESAAIERLRQLIRRIGPTAAGVAVTGPSGSGRTLVANAVHAASLDPDHPLTSIDLRDETQWRRLTGGADAVLLRYPDRLDEVSQSRLVELLPASLRTIAIVDRIAELGPALRSRIATIEIPVPPLAARDRDALLLARHFARLAATRHGFSAPTFTPAAEQLVVQSTWIDEVRGLALAVERALLLAEDGVIDAATLAPPVATPVEPSAPATAFDLSDNERAVIAAALREHHHNVTHAATALGLSRGALYRRMERYGL